MTVLAREATWILINPYMGLQKASYYTEWLTIYIATIIQSMITINCELIVMQL